MSVYVDRVRDHGDAVKGQARRYGTKWSHLIADTEDELHAFAARIGLRRSWAQYPGTPKFHYDVIPTKRALAIRFGAIEVDDRTFISIRHRQGADDSSTAHDGDGDRANRHLGEQP